MRQYAIWGWVWTVVIAASSLFAAEPRAIRSGEREKPTKPEVAQVPKSLQNDRAYSLYAKMLVEIDLLADEQTAGLPVICELPKAGTLLLTGTVPSEAHRKYLLENARRIGGLAVRDGLEIGDVDDDSDWVEDEDLRRGVQDTLQLLFSEEVTRHVRVQANDGVVFLSGSLPSIESKLLLSQAAKSQPGCRAVANLAEVVLDPKLGDLWVTQDGSLTLVGDQLPAVPLAQPVALDSQKPRRLPSDFGGGGMLANDAPDGVLAASYQADDAPFQKPSSRTLQRTIRETLDRDTIFRDRQIEIQVERGEVTFAVEDLSQDSIAKAVDLIAGVPGVTKVVAKCSPVSIQRNLPTRVSADQDEESSPSKRTWMSYLTLPWSNSLNLEDKPYESRRFRETVRKTLEKRCEKRIEEVRVRSTVDRMMIQAKVRNARDRTWVLRQIDQIVELRQIPYEVILTVKE